MKKLSIALGLLVWAFSFAAAEEQRPIDLVVVLDTSASMNASYRSVSEYVIGPMLKEFLRRGDTFHLIGFSGAPRAEVSRRIAGIGDVETIIARMLLMYPLDPHSDVIAALEYVSRYLADLPDTRPKTIVFISDGEHAPPPSSPYAGLDPESVKVRLADAATRLKGNGWTFHLVRVPFSGSATLGALPGAPSSRPTRPSSGGASAEGEEGRSGPTKPTVAAAGEKEGGAAGPAAPGEERKRNGGIDVSDEVADLLAAPVVDVSTDDSESSLGAALGAVKVRFPPDIGKSDRSVSIPLSVYNPSPNAVYLETKSVLVDGIDRMSKRGFRELGPRSEGTLNLRITLPADYPIGRASLNVEPVFAGTVRITPQSGSVSLEVVEAPFVRFFAAAFPAVVFSIGLALAALLAFLVIALSRRLSTAPGQAVSAAPATGGHRSEAKRASGAAAGTSAAVRTGDPTAIAHGVAAPPARAGEPALERPGPADDTADLLASFAKRSADDRASQAALPMRTSPGNEPSGISLAASPPLAAASGEPPRSAGRRAGTDIPSASYEVRRADARIMLSLFVEDQNTLIGRRNIHLLKAGTSLSLGGGNSDFLVFLVPVPRRIAEIHFDGERCIFLPRKPDFFPDIGGEPVVDCVGKTIRVLSQKGYELKIRLDRFEDPLASLNRFLHSIEMPGR